MSDNTIECPQCEGKGLWITESNKEGRTCVNCDGKGTITNPNKEQKMNLKNVAEETLNIVSKGKFIDRKGRIVKIKKEVAWAIEASSMYDAFQLEVMYNDIKQWKAK